MNMLMKCGHIATCADVRGRPFCIKCRGKHPGATEPEDEADLQGRRARCLYYGWKMKYWGKIRNECPKCKDRWTYAEKYTPCQCEVDSDWDLPLFTYRPGKEFDWYYCGCHGWDK